MNANTEFLTSTNEAERSNEEAAEAMRGAIAKLRSRTTGMPVQVRTHQYGRQLSSDHPAISGE
jgi:hypothetical protein